MASKQKTIVWLRQDLRLLDNPALFQALKKGDVLALYIHHVPDAWPMGEASQWWLHHSLLSLQASCQKQGLSFIIKTGNPQEVIQALQKEIAATHVYWNRCYEPEAIERDSIIKQTLKESGINVSSFNGSLFREPWEVLTKTGSAYKIFTPYWKASRAVGELALQAPQALPASKFLKHVPQSDRVDALGLLPSRDWADDFPTHWQPGEEGAHDNLQRFLKSALTEYDQGRNFPIKQATSHLSPHLHFGEISPTTIYWAVRDAASKQSLSMSEENIACYVSELGWRDFSYYLLYHFKDLPDEPLRERFTSIPWHKDMSELKAWQRGLTGYPIVDAGMRELWQTGYMHNRVRMIVGSFLTKHLFIDWRYGAAWFWDTLLDADLASNSASWQWVAGCGTDATPYFRIFNPVTQGEKFDGEGEYIKRWVPELTKLPKKWIHKPWLADTTTLDAAGVELGNHYPEPIVDHKYARERYLAAFKQA